MKILDLGCGNNKGKDCPYEGKVVGVDKDWDSQADVIHDLDEFPYPFKDNEFDAVFANHSLEHLSDTTRVMDELWRITKPNGKVFILVPNVGHPSSFNNPTHKKFFAIDGIYYFTHLGKPKFKLLRKKYNFIPVNLPVDGFKIDMLRLLTKPMDWLCNINHTIYEMVNILPAGEILWEMEVVK